MKKWFFKKKSIMKRLYFLCFALMFFGIQISAQNYALRFFGNGVSDIDRVKIPIDNPERNADVGFDFTIEFQMKADLNENPLGYDAVQGNNDDWVLGHVIVDRDIFGPGDNGDYGISLADGRIAFGINNGEVSYTIIGNSSVADGIWKHIAVTRNSASGVISIFVDGQLDKTANTDVLGDISYRNGRNTDWENDPYIVLGAEKHDYDNNFYPSYSGYIDELRISNIVRYVDNYSPQIKLIDDENTVALYHFDEGDGNILYDYAEITGNNSDGTIMYGGTPFGPVWVINDIEPDNNNIEINLTINPVDAGEVSGAGIYQIGETVNIEATPNAGYAFLYWTENDVSISHENPFSFVADEDRNITVEFAITTQIYDYSSMNAFSLYPNPNNGIVNFKINKQTDSNLKINIYSYDFRLLKSIIFENQNLFNVKEIDISDFAPGTYIVEIQTKDTFEIHKIIVK